MDSQTIAKRIWDVFTDPRPPLRARYASKEDIRDKITGFSPFNKVHAAKAGTYIQTFREIVTAAKDEFEGLTTALDSFLQFREYENPDLLYYALQSFLVNHKGQILYTIPSLIAREPEFTIPSSSAGEIQIEVAVGSTAETKMDWFREDPSINEHHGHWHLVYNNRLLKDRQGEMFFYMHQQMIARYDADRLSSGISRVAPFDDMSTQLIKVGYAPGEDVRLSNFIQGERAPNISVSRSNAIEQVSDLEKIRADIDSNYYRVSHPYEPAAEIKAVNTLGATIEQNLQADDTRSYTNYHGNGHGYIGLLNNGVMLLTETAVRDVVFWEWHKGVDDIYFRLQERFQPNDFSSHAAGIILRKQVLDNGRPYTPDIIICLNKDLPPNAGELADTLFGEANWEQDFEEKSVTAGGVTTRTIKTLTTTMNTGSISYRDENGMLKTYDYPYLSHEPFSYFLRLENTKAAPQLVTIRIFLAPEETAEDRRSWIEMDKFVSTIPSRTKKVIFRKDIEASVIKKPAVLDPSTYHIQYDPLDMPIDDRQCNCGWPYHLLIPKGKEGGMNFRLLVFVTDGKFDGLASESNCGSISFCGSRVGDYPDKRPMGFPFNRKFDGAGNNITKTINSVGQMMCRTISITHTV